jgi:hypothetical protein
MGIDPINKISIIIRILFAVTLFQHPKGCLRRDPSLQRLTTCKIRLKIENPVNTLQNPSNWLSCALLWLLMNPQVSALLFLSSKYLQTLPECRSS